MNAEVLTVLLTTILLPTYIIFYSLCKFMLLFFCQSSSSCSPSSSCTVSNMVGFCFFLSSSSPCSCVNLWPNKYTIVRRAKVAKVTKMISKEYWGGMASTRACSSLHSGLWETYVYSYSKTSEEPHMRPYPESDYTTQLSAHCRLYF